MKISKTHQALSNRLKNPEVLTNPEPFLGPNWETVLRWWLYFESFTYGQMDDLYRLYYDINQDAFSHAWYLAFNAAEEVIGVNNKSAVYYATSESPITMELIAMHLLFERDHSLTFVPLIKDF